MGGDRPLRHRGERGVSLVELVLVMTLIGVLFAAAIQPIAQALRSRQAVADSLATLDQARLLMDRVARELRQARRDPDSSLVELWPLHAADRTSQGICVQRVSRAEPAEAISVVFEEVNGALRFAVAAGERCPSLAGVALDRLPAGSLHFTYLGADASGQLQALSVADLARLQGAVRAVEVQLELEAAQGTVSQQLRVFLRNGSLP